MMSSTTFGPLNKSMGLRWTIYFPPTMWQVGNLRVQKDRLGTTCLSLFEVLSPLKGYSSLQRPSSSRDACFEVTYRVKSKALTHIMWELRGQVVKGWNSAKMGDIPSTWIMVDPITRCPPNKSKEFGWTQYFQTTIWEVGNLGVCPWE